jgi:Coenzyme PQQ synthesis protein D (PqqD)
MSLPQRRSDVAAQTIGGETVLQDPSNDQVHVVNSTAAWIWDRLDGTRRPEDIGSELAATFDVSPEQATRDLTDLLRSFEALGLLA